MNRMLPVAIVIAIVLSLTPSVVAAQPYGSSTAILSVTFDPASHDRRAPGSDNWPITWADDGNQYTSWGDGGGFGGTNSNGRVSLGFGRVEGAFDAYSGFNVWGGFMPETPATFGGKSYGLLGIDSNLYAWVSPGSGPMGYTRATLQRSSNDGRSWTAAGWSFTNADDLVFPTILQFGRGYAGSLDDFVYSYSIRLQDASGLNVHRPGMIDLMRAPRDRLMRRGAYEFFAGLDAGGAPIWVADVSMRQPVFEDPEGVGWNASVSWNAGLGRFLLSTEHIASMEGRLGIFDAPTPWGPWTTVLYSGADWEGFGTTFYWNFANKWLSADGRDFTLVFTGVGENDSWNTIRGSFDVGALPDGGVGDAGMGDAGAGDGGTDDAGGGDSGAPTDSGAPGGDSGGGSLDGSITPPGDDGGCGCRANGARGSTPVVLGALVLLLAVRRRRR